MDFIFNLPYYQELLGSNTIRKKRGGPYYERTAAQWNFINQVALKMQVTDEHLANGTGYLQLFDLQGKYSQTQKLLSVWITVIITVQIIDLDYSETELKLIVLNQTNLNWSSIEQVFQYVKSFKWL